jgi:hypothetical protein
MSKAEILNIINTYPLSQRLDLIKSILDQINLEEHELEEVDFKKQNNNSLVEFTGIWDEKTANAFHNSIEDCRKVDFNEW